MKKELLIFRRHLAARGLRGTAPREEVLRCLLAEGGHRSPEAIYAELRRGRTSVGRATVFRTLKLLEECGLASKVMFADGSARYERAMGRAHHDHMICVDCGHALEFESPSIERIQNREATRRGFRVLWHRHELFGRCRGCASKAGAR